MSQTLVKNISGEDNQFLGYLPPHGLVLDDDEEVVLDGDLRTVLAGGRNRYSRSRELEALDEDIAAGRVEISQLPNVSSSAP